MVTQRVQTRLALFLGCSAIYCVVTGLVKPYPAVWSWEKADEIMGGYPLFYIWSVLAILYYPVIFGYASERGQHLHNETYCVYPVQPSNSWT